MARLDRLGSAKAVSQIGAAIGREFSYALLAVLAGLSERELNSSLNRLVQSGLLSRQGSPPHTTYLFKHALVQDAAYGTMLREPRRALHARIAEALESQFAEIAEAQPELPARHCTEAGLIDKAAGLWGKAGQRSLARSALIEAATHLTRALAQIATLPSTPSLRREQIKLQVGLANATMQIKGYAAPETKGSLEEARVFIERAEALGEPLEDPLALFSILYGVWGANFVAFNEDAVRELAAHFLALAQKQGGTVPIMIGHRLVGSALLTTGDIGEGRAHLDRAIALFDPKEHRQLAARFATDVRVMILSWRPLALWALGYPEAARADADAALGDAREIGHAVELMYALNATQPVRILLQDYAAVKVQADEGIVLADKKGAFFWKALGTMFQGCVFAGTRQAAKAVSSIVSAITSYRSTGATLFTPFVLSYLAIAHASVGQIDDARRCIGEARSAAETAGERWCEAEIHRMAGEIELLSPERDVAKAQAHFERALEIARAQQARSWELRAATSLARLWRDQGKVQQARELLAPVYEWFTEGFDTRDLKEARALLEELQRA
jgi:predicted ATPase